MDLHELTAAYALDALDRDEAEAYERHLGQCEECREQLAELNGAAANLAFGAVSPVPPAGLRASILDAAAAERTNVVPLVQRRWVARGLAVAAAAAACVVVGLAVALTRSSHPQVLTAFRTANKVMAVAARRRGLMIQGTDPAKADSPKWRPFQLAFLLMNLEGVVKPGQVVSKDVETNVK